MAARVLRGSKKIFWRGPAFSKYVSGIDRLAGGDFNLVADARFVGHEIADAVAALHLSASGESCRQGRGCG
jgi:hypothetical protein